MDRVADLPWQRMRVPTTLASEGNEADVNRVTEDLDDVINVHTKQALLVFQSH